MRLIIVWTVVAAMVLTARLSAGNLDAQVPGEFVIDRLPGINPCAFGVMIDQIARQANVRIGFETTARCWLSPRSRENRDHGERLTGMTARQALDHFVADVPTYRWQERDGVAVVRPKAAWDDLNNVLNATVPSLSISAAHVSDAVSVAYTSASVSNVRVTSTP